MNLKKQILSGICIIFLYSLLHGSVTFAADNVRQTSITQNAATIMWTPQQNEKYYEIYYYDYTSVWSGNTRKKNYLWIYAGKTSGNSFTLTGLEGGNEYDVYVYAFNSDDNTEGMKQIKVRTIPAVPTKMEARLKGASLSKTKNIYKLSYNLYVDFEEQDSADGYDIYLFNAKGKRVKKVTERKTDSLIHEHIFYSLKDPIYSVKVRAYTTLNGVKKYGSWSAPYYSLRQPASVARSAGGVYVRWEKINGATGYEVYMLDKKKGKFKKVASSGKNKDMVYIPKYNKKSFIKGKVYYYYVVAKKKSKSVVYKSELSQVFKVNIY